MTTGERCARFGVSRDNTSTRITREEEFFLFPGMRTINLDGAGSSVVVWEGVWDERAVVLDVRPSNLACTSRGNQVRLPGGPVLCATWVGLVRGGVRTLERCLSNSFVVTT